MTLIEDISNYYLQWTDDYSIGNPDIDRQHKTLIERYNQLVDVLAEQPEVQVLESHLVAFKAIAEHHFNTEEAYMIHKGYTEFFTHQLAHLHLLDRLDAMVRNCNGLDCHLLEVLSDWLSNHLREEDAKLAHI